MSAIRNGCRGSVEEPANVSKGCGGVMRVAPIGLYFGGSDMASLPVIHTLGPGWCGDEALAVAVYCAVKYQDDFDKAVRAAVNHSGDSDSTGAITGNILGAYLGLSRIPQKYIDNLELANVIMEIADDFYEDCQIDGHSDFNVQKNKDWFNKYVKASYKGRK